MRARVAAGLLLAGFAAGSACAQESGQDPRARSVYENSRDTRATYANYGWNWVRSTDPASSQSGWSAEFHKGGLHRVETPDMRVVADCETGIGTGFFVHESRTETGPQFALAACGINANPDIVELQWIDRVESRFGPLDRIRLVDDSFDRTYAVNEAGVLVATEMFSNQPDSGECVQNEAIAIEDELPEEDIFSPQSLKRSVVPEKYRTAPAAPKGDYWLDGFRCR
jgi:hypothetical protein